MRVCFIIFIRFWICADDTDIGTPSDQPESTSINGGDTKLDKRSERGWDGVWTCWMMSSVKSMFWLYSRLTNMGYWIVITFADRYTNSLSGTQTVARDQKLESVGKYGQGPPHSPPSGL